MQFEELVFTFWEPLYFEFTLLTYFIYLNDMIHFLLYRVLESFLNLHESCNLSEAREISKTGVDSIPILWISFVMLKVNSSIICHSDMDRFAQSTFTFTYETFVDAGL